MFKPKPIVVKKKKPKEESDEDDPETLARIKHLERGRQGFNPMELGKVKYKDDLNDLKETLFPYNPKFDTLPQSMTLSNANTDDSVQNEGPPAKVYGPSSTSCPCCEMEVRHGTKFLFLRCCKSLYH